MKKFLIIIIFCTINFMCTKNKSAIDSINIPHEIFKLDNGLTVIFHEDHKSSIVSVNIWYHVGSKNEKSGKTGFAHLFEHLMLNGSENHNKDYLEALEKIGATDLNATTNNDRTNYFETVPVGALDRVLWLESDKMGHMLGVVDQAKLDEQRGVVQNEKRQYENMPYVVAWELYTKSTWPHGHPYSWTILGSMEDLNAATLDDVREWFKTYYGPSNAVISIAGDMDLNTIKEKVKKYFGDIPPGPPVSRYHVNIAKMRGTIRQSVQDRVPQSRIYKVWNVPQYCSIETVHLDLLANILSKGKTSRLYKRLVYDEQIAADVSSYIDPHEIAGQFYIEVTANPGLGLKKIEQVIDEELKKLINQGPTEDELERVKTENIADFLRDIERIGGLGGKSDILAKSLIYAGNTDYYKTRLKYVEGTSAKDIMNTGKTWLSDGQYVLEITPYNELNSGKANIELRKKIPDITENFNTVLPGIQRDKLSNGLKILLINRKSIPVINFKLLIDAGYASDIKSKPGVAKMAVDMLDEGTKKSSALDINDRLAMLGATFETSSNLDQSILYMSALKVNLEDSLEIFSEILLHPAFPKDEFKRMKKQYVAEIQNEKMNPKIIPYRVLPGILYGKEHPYGNPLTGSGTEESISSLTLDDITNFYASWVKPNNATLAVVGDITMEELKPELESLLGDWEQGKVPEKNISKVNDKDKSIVYLIDKPAAVQSVIIAAHVILPTNNENELAIQVMNKILGEIFSSRINMNLREDKHWSYLASSKIMDAMGQRPFFVLTSVQTNRTKESMIEIKKEINDITNKRPVTYQEFDNVQKKMVFELAGAWETNDAILKKVSSMVRFGYPNDYYSTFVKKVRSLKQTEVINAAKNILKPEKLVWVVVGDKSKIENKIKSLNYGEIKYINADGKEL